MNQRKIDVLPSWLNPCAVVSGSAFGDFASDGSGSRSSVYPFACTVRGTEAADPRALGVGRCK